MQLKELEKFLKICRRQGVTEITFEGTSVKLGDLPFRSKNDDQEESDEIPSDGISEEEMAFYHLPRDER